MLTTLRVRDLATIREVTLELGPGLNVLTGETGAGKSLLVDSLALLLGDRADRAVVRPGAARAIIEGTVEEIGHPVRQWLEANGLDPGETLVLRREVTAEGRSRAWINGSPATIGVLAALGELLVDLHGQHQTVQLLNAATQRVLLDGFADATRQAEAVAVAFRTLADRQEELASLDRRREAAARQADWLRFVADEISSARLEPGEDARLEREALRLGQAGSLAELARRIVLAIDDEEGGARHALAQADRACQQLERLDPEVVAWRELLDPAFAQLAELAQRAAEYADGLAEDPDRLAEVERRRDLIQELKRKHGPTIEEVRAVGKRAAEELDLLDTSELDRRLLAAGVAGAERQLREAAERLSAIRQDGARRLAREVGRILPRLGLAGGEFSVQLQPTGTIGVDGAESVAFLVRLNAGMEPRPLAKVASGGELSRLMLALKVVLARQDAVPTLVFDEIDQGIGGEVGLRVGEALAKASTRHQVLVITHLPQIAARADRHLRIAKGTRQGVATSDVEPLHGEDRVIELARMLGSADDAAARRLARSLLEGATA